MAVTMTQAEHEAAFGQGFDVATESHKEALDIMRERIAELEAEARALRQTILTIAETGNKLAQSVVRIYAREGRDLFGERRGAKI